MSEVVVIGTVKNTVVENVHICETCQAVTVSENETEQHCETTMETMGWFESTGKEVETHVQDS